MLKIKVEKNPERPNQNFNEKEIQKAVQSIVNWSNDPGGYVKLTIEDD